jgi:indolepyruvate ferredoxin oxidoreductase
MVGFAYQKGLIPLSATSIERAIEINGAAVEFNKQAFLWGRRAAADLATVEQAAALPAQKAELWRNIDEVIASRETFLSGYQSTAYAKRYRKRVEQVRVAEKEKSGGSTALTESVARNYFKLLAYKDEYEVARLYSDGKFLERVESLFEGDYTLQFHLAPPILEKRDPNSGEPRKRAFGPWMMKAFAFLAPLKVLRGTPLDVFGYTEERREERALIKEYEQIVDELTTGLAPENRDTAVAIASYPARIRGFGHVKRKSIPVAKAELPALLEAFRNPMPESAAA